MAKEEDIEEEALLETERNPMEPPIEEEENPEVEEVATLVVAENTEAEVNLEAEVTLEEIEKLPMEKTE